MGDTGLEPVTSCVSSRTLPVEKPASDAQDAASGLGDEARCTNGCTPFPEAVSNDPQFRRIAEAWEGLSDPQRTQIMAGVGVWRLESAFNRDSTHDRRGGLTSRVLDADTMRLRHMEGPGRCWS